MSEPKRYNPSGLVCTCCGKPDAEILSIMVTHKKGRYVLWEDYVALDKLCKKLSKHHSDISCENIMLRKAGDAVALDYAERIEIEAGDTAKNLMRKLPVLREWNAAKEGKQS